MYVHMCLCTCPCLPVQMHGRTNGRLGGMMEGWMDRWIDGSMDRWMDGWMDGRVDGWLDGWMDGCAYGWVRTVIRAYIYICNSWNSKEEDHTCTTTWLTRLRMNRHGMAVHDLQLVFSSWHSGNSWGLTVEGILVTARFRVSVTDSQPSLEAQLWDQ